MSDRPCGWCLYLCWQCRERHEQLKRTYAEQEERVTALEIAFAEADDRDRDEINERLTGEIEALRELAEELDGDE